LKPYKYKIGFFLKNINSAKLKIGFYPEFLFFCKILIIEAEFQVAID